MTYFNSDGKPTELGALCRTEPEWAASRLRIARREHELACAAADAWIALCRHNDKRIGISPGLARELDALEAATRESPLRKVRP